MTLMSSGIKIAEDTKPETSAIDKLGAGKER